MEYNRALHLLLLNMANMDTVVPKFARVNGYRYSGYCDARNECDSRNDCDTRCARYYGSTCAARQRSGEGREAGEAVALCD